MTNKIGGAGGGHEIRGPEAGEVACDPLSADQLKQMGVEPPAAGSGAPNAKQTARPKSMSAHDVGLKSQLEERLKAAGAGGAKKSDATAEVLDGADAEWAQLEKEAAEYKGKLDQAFPGYKVKAEVTDFGAFSFDLTPKGGGKPFKVELQTIDEFTIKMTAPDGKSKSVGVVYGEEAKALPDFDATVRDLGRQLGMGTATATGGAGKAGAAGAKWPLDAAGTKAAIEKAFENMPGSTAKPTGKPGEWVASDKDGPYMWVVIEKGKVRIEGEENFSASTSLKAGDDLVAKLKELRNK